jgi:hypothetical protein
LSASLLMRPASRRRSFFGEIASISLIAEGLIRILYFATLFQIFQDVFEGKVGFVCALIEGS